MGAGSAKISAFALAAAAALAFFANRAAKADDLTFYAYPSPLGINWDSPEQLGWSGLASEVAFDPRFKEIHSIGHVQIELNCEAGASGPARHILTGMTNTADSEFVHDLLEQGYGLGLLLSSFSGKEEDAADIQADFPARYQSGRIGFLHFLISPSSCQRAVAYLDEYHSRGYDKIYGGLADRPRYGEGSGCSAFGESVLEIAGMMEPPWYADWTRSIRVPYSLVGGPLTGQNVNLAEILFGPHAMNWASEDERAFPIFFWDPDRIFNWIGETWKEISAHPGGAYFPLTRGNAMGLLLDRRDVPTPTDSFWKN